MYEYRIPYMNNLMQVGFNSSSAIDWIIANGLTWQELPSDVMDVNQMEMIGEWDVVCSVTIQALGSILLSA